MSSDPVKDKLNIMCGAIGEVVANVFNSTPVALRPVALAALHLSVCSAVATMSESDRAVYSLALGSMDVAAVKIPRKP